MFSFVSLFPVASVWKVFGTWFLKDQSLCSRFVRKLLRVSCPFYAVFWHLLCSCEYTSRKVTHELPDENIITSRAKLVESTKFLARAT